MASAKAYDSMKFLSFGLERILQMERSKIVAIVTGAISILLAIGYLLLVQILDFRGEMIPAPVSFLGTFM
jgi:hypothetical protein